MLHRRAEEIAGVHHHRNHHSDGIELPPSASAITVSDVNITMGEEEISPWIAPEGDGLLLPGRGADRETFVRPTLIHSTPIGMM